MRNFSSLDITISNEQGPVDHEVVFDETCSERGLDKSISSSWIIKHNSENNNLTINIKSKKDRNDFVSLEGVRLFRTFNANLSSENK